MSDRVTLGDLSGTYRRVSNGIYRVLEDGYDFAVDERLINTLDLDALIVDAAFFALTFGQLENRLTEPAIRRIGEEKCRQQSIREARGLALPAADDAAPRDEIAGWYQLRNRAAHGERLTGSYNVAALFERAFELDQIVSEQLGHADERGSPAAQSGTSSQ